MSAGNELLVIVLQECDRLSPEPYYPAAHVERGSLDRDRLDEALDRLRLAGLLKLTPWVQGKGQGYELTEEGRQTLSNSRMMSQMQARGVAPKPVERPRPALGSTNSWDKGEAVRNTILQPIAPVVTYTIVAICVGFFFVGLGLAMQQGVGGEYLGFGRNNPFVNEIRDNLGAVRPEGVYDDHQWWRLLSYAFVHGSIMHIIFNMAFLLSVGPVVERMFGSVRFAILYIVSAIGGGFADIYKGQSAVGASGAMCGLLAAMTI